MQIRVRVMIVLLVLSAGCVACNVSTTASIDREEAQKLSDSFMSDLVNNKVAEAVNLMESGFVKSLGSKDAEATIRKLFEYCGQPKEYEFRHDEIGTRMYLDGRTKPMRKFFYVGATTMHPRGICFFAVEIVPGDNDLRVASFGPLKVLTGKPPEWAR